MCYGHEEADCWHWQHSVETALIAPAFTSVLLFDSMTQMAFPVLPQLVPLSQELPWDRFIFLASLFGLLDIATISRSFSSLYQLNLGVPRSFLQPISQG